MLFLEGFDGLGSFLVIFLGEKRGTSWCWPCFGSRGHWERNLDLCHLSGKASTVVKHIEHSLLLFKLCDRCYGLSLLNTKENGQDWPLFSSDKECLLRVNGDIIIRVEPCILPSPSSAYSSGPIGVLSPKNRSYPRAASSST